MLSLLFHQMQSSASNAQPKSIKTMKKSLLLQGRDLHGLLGFLRDGSGLQNSMLLYHHSCGFVALCEAPRHPHSQGQ